jgi:hypothetical protein
MRRFELRRIAELERKIPHRAAPIDPEEACRAYAAMCARVNEEHHNAPHNESLTAVEATQRYQRMLKYGSADEKRGMKRRRKLHDGDETHPLAEGRETLTVATLARWAAL